MSALPFLVCWGCRVSCVGRQSPIRSLGRLPVGLGSLNKIPCHLQSLLRSLGRLQVGLSSSNKIPVPPLPSLSLLTNLHGSRWSWLLGIKISCPPHAQCVWHGFYFKEPRPTGSRVSPKKAIECCCCITNGANQKARPKGLNLKVR